MDSTLSRWSPVVVEPPAGAPRQRRAARTILLYSGWQTVNIGDVGHSPGTLRYLEEADPDAELTLWLSQANPAVVRMLRQRFPRVSLVRGTLDAEGRASTPSLQQAFARADLLICNSGMHFNRFWDGPVDLLRACVHQRKRFGLYGQSFDGFATEDRPAMRRLLSEAAFIGTRDVDSLYYLRRMGVHRPRMAFVPDGCFGIDVQDHAAADRFLGRCELEPGRYMTLTIRTHSPKLGGGSSALNPARPTEAQRRENQAWARSLRRVIVYWIRRTGLPVLLAPEVDKEIPAAKDFLLDRLPPAMRPWVHHRDTFWNVDEAASVYARARLVLSMEPHSCIIALANGTPAIHWYSQCHGVKAGMFRDIGLPEWLFDIDRDPVGAIAGEADWIHRHQPEARRRVAYAMQGVHQKAHEFLLHHQPA